MALFKVLHSHLWWDVLSCHYDPHVCGLINLSLWLFVWFLICGFVQILFLSLIVNFKFSSSNFPVTALGLDLFSGTYFNTFLWCPVIENDSIQVVHEVLCLKMELEPASKTLGFLKKKKKIAHGQSTSSLLIYWHLSLNIDKEFPL